MTTFLIPTLSRFRARALSPLLVSTLLAGTALTLPAHAQQTDTTGALPTVRVSPPTQKKPAHLPKKRKQTDAKPRVHQAPAQLVAPPAPGTPASANPEASRVAEIGGLVGSSTTVITAQDIARSPGQTIQDILATEPGIQLSSNYGSVNGAATTIDMRGFGATAASNTLVLVNGRRINNIDLAGFDLSTIPLQSVERIEITRGNSAAVLYGDNAVGGAINIITKTGAGGPPVSGRVEAGVGSDGQRFGNASATTNYGPWSTSTYFSENHSDGYRQNNKLDEQAGSGDIRYTTPDLKAYFNVSGDNQHLGLPGGRTVDPGSGINELATDRRGAATPLDYADKQDVNLATGLTKTLWNGIDFTVDGGLRRRMQQSEYFFGGSSYSYIDATLQTWSITPRLSIRGDVFGMSSTVLTGVDYYDASYESDRGEFNGAAPIHVYNVDQQTLAGYWQQKLGILPNTDLSYGGRIQNNRLSARDNYNSGAPGAFGTPLAPLDSNETQHALDIGLEHRFNETFAVFARAARAFRTPNVDERIGSSPYFSTTPNFNLKTQTSYDVEGGFKIHQGAFDLQASYYDMHLKNELHYDPINGIDTNLDPTHRYGTETLVTYRINDDVRLKGSFAYTRAVFEEGLFAGNDVPLVARFSGSAGVSWNIWQNYLVFDATLRAWSKRRLDSDETNTGPFNPGNATVDLKLGGSYDRYFWSASLNNAFNALYYDYGVVSTFTPGAYSAYPLPGRTYLLKIGATF